MDAMKAKFNHRSSSEIMKKMVEWGLYLYPGVPLPESCSTVFTSGDALDVEPDMAAKITEQEFLDACFRKNGPCCEAVCKNELRCHNAQTHIVRIRFSHIESNSCIQPSAAVAQAATAAEGMSATGSLTDGTTIVKVCGAHYKTLTDAARNGWGWKFLRWGAYAGAVGVCSFVVIPIATTLVTGAVTALAAAALPPTVTTALAAPISMLSSLAVGKVTWPAVSRTTSTAPRVVNQLANVYSSKIPTVDPSRIASTRRQKRPTPY